MTMFFELIGTIVAGAAAALLVWAINRLLGGRLPKWLMPVGAGAAMLVATISNEYGWYGRTSATLPEGVVVAEAIPEAALYRPWTYVAPMTVRFSAVDQVSLRQHPDFPDIRLVDVFLFGRWSPTAKVPMFFDCAGGRQAALTLEVAYSADGALRDAPWEAVDAQSPLLSTACGVI